MVENKNRIMVENIADIAEEIKTKIQKSISGDRDLMNLVFKAYNDFQESEFDGADYIHNIDDKDDLMCCIKGGMTTKEIAHIYNESQVNSTPYFFFGANYPQPKMIANEEELCDVIMSRILEIVVNVLAYPYAYKSYQDLYVKYVTNVMIENFAVLN